MGTDTTVTSHFVLSRMRMMSDRRRLAWTCFGACLLLLSACDVYHPEAFEGYDAGVDAGSLDAGVRLDAGSLDAGPLDSGVLDAGPLDSGTADAGPFDSGTADAEVAEAGVADAAADDAG